MILGLTGNFGSGKSTAAKMFKDLGAVIIDVDEISHRVLAGECYGEVISEFSSDILDYDLKIDRDLLREIVFNDRYKLKKLEIILHPRILNEIELELRRLDTKHSIVIIEAAVLIELGLLGIIDKLIVITSICQKERLTWKSRIKEEEINKILRLQMDEAALEAKADFIIDNNGTPDNTRAQINEIWKKLGA